MEDAIFLMATEEESRLPFVLKSIGLRKSQEHMIRPEGYPDYHWLHCTRGEGCLFLDNREFVLKPGDGFFLCPGVPHEYFSTGDPWETHWITFNGVEAANVAALFNLENYVVFREIDITKIDMLLDEIYAHARNPIPYRGYECSHLVYKFMIELKFCTDRSAFSGRNAVIERLQPVIDYIETNYARGPSLEDMAGVIKVTPRHLCRIFRQAFNMSPFAYLTAYRIKRAKELLISSPDLTVGKVAEMAGYNNCSYFCAVFKASEGLTPLEFMRMNKLY